MEWRLLLHEVDDSILGMDTINLTCTLARRYASYRGSIHWVAHGCIMVLAKGMQKLFSCLLAAWGWRGEDDLY
jgi:hypothetical protein